MVQVRAFCHPQWVLCGYISVCSLFSPLFLFISHKISCWAGKWAGWRWWWPCRRASSPLRLHTAAGGDPETQTRHRNSQSNSVSTTEIHCVRYCNKRSEFIVVWERNNTWYSNCTVSKCTPMSLAFTSNTPTVSDGEISKITFLYLWTEKSKRE